MKKLLKPKYHLIYGALAQIVILAINLAVLITKKYNIDDTSLLYDLAILIIPNFFYTAFVTLFYYIYWKNIGRESRRKAKFNSVLFNTIIIANLIYYATLIMNSGIGLYIMNGLVSNINYVFTTDFAIFDIKAVTTNGLYYINTTIIQIINAFFASKYILFDAEPITTGKEQVVLKTFIYIAVITTILSLYFCFDNIFMAWAFIVISAIVLFISYSIYHSHFMRNLYRKSSEDR